MRVLVSEEIWAFDLEAALKEISEQRREQALKFKHEQGQRLCVLAYQLLKQGLREEYGIEENPIFEYRRVWCGSCPACSPANRRRCR